MKEMRLFEVGFKEKVRSLGYYSKVNVGASGALEAVEKARLHLVEETNRWWNENDGREEAIFSAYVEDKKAPDGLSDAEVLATEKYQKAARKDFDDEMERIKNLYLAKVLDIGTLIV